jgi:hypothetical protein
VLAERLEEDEENNNNKKKTRIIKLFDEVKNDKRPFKN